jgi:hypothetical protein
MLQGPQQEEISMALKKPTRRGRAEPIRINLGAPDDVAYWARRFGCTAPELEEAVHTVGVNAEVVCTLIARRKRSGD